MADFDEAIRLAPTDAEAYYCRGTAYFDQHQPDRAIADYNEAIRLDRIAHFEVRVVMSLAERGRAWNSKGEYDKALVNLDEAIRLDPRQAMALDRGAWIRATCPDAMVRDGRRAVEVATRACERAGWKRADYLDTLAAAMPRPASSTPPSIGRPGPTRWIASHGTRRMATPG